jgi:glycine C-acetyltransferase
VLFTALLAPDDLVILTDPCPAPLHAAAELAPADVVHVPRGDLEALASTLSAGHPGRLRLLVTEAVSSLDGVPLPLAEMAGLARHHEALLLLDDTEGVGVLGPGGRGSAASLGSGESPFLLTGSASGALGPAKWGFVAGDREVMEAVRFHAASLTGPSACTQDALSAAAHYLHLAVRGDAARTQVLESAAYFRTRLETAAFSVRSGSHPLLAVELPDEASAHKMAAALLADRIVVRPVTSILGAKTNSNSSGPSFLRVKLSAAHYTTELDGAVVSFIQAGRRLGVLPTFCMYQRKR